MALLPALAVLYCGCARSPAPATAPSQTGGDPRASAQQLVDLRAQHRYRELSELIVPPHARTTVDFLMAVDEFLAANQRLCLWVRDHVGVGLSQMIDQAYVADDLALYAGDDLGVFGGRVELLDGSYAGDEAVVSYLAAERLPARQVHLRRVDGHWRFDPRQAPSKQLPAAFRELATSLNLVRQQLASGAVAPQDLRDNPERLAEMVKARLRRGVALLSKARDTGTTRAGP